MERYREKLATLPASGGGGCHPALLGAASLGVMCGIPASDIFRDLRQQVHGERSVPDREIQAAVNKAVSEHASGIAAALPHTGVRRSSRAVIDGPAALRRIVEQGRGVSEADIHERSPVRIDWQPEEDAFRVIETLWRPDDVLFIGTRDCQPAVNRNIRTAAEWCAAFRKGRPGGHQPHIIPNPLTGKPGPTADGNGETLRGDACVAQFRFAVVEFDGLTREDQLAFWWAVRLPVALLVDSGGKSVHGWVRVQGVSCATDWSRVVERHLFGDLLEPLGVDPACKNESRLSRLPGHFRKEKDAWQRVLYLAPNGKAVAS
jgi:hypothetical protein